MKIQFPEKLIIAHLYISGQFNMCGFSIQYVLSCDRDSMGGGLLLYIRDGITTKLSKHDFGTNIENL